MRAYLAVILLGLLAGCTTVHAGACPPMREYSQEFNQRLADELQGLPDNSATLEAIQDYIGLRDQLRTCQ